MGVRNMDEKTNKFDEFEEVLKTSKKDGKYVIRLFVAGINPKSKKAIENLKELCDENLKNVNLKLLTFINSPYLQKKAK